MKNEVIQKNNGLNEIQRKMNVVKKRILELQKIIKKKPRDFVDEAKNTSAQKELREMNVALAKLERELAEYKEQKRAA